MQDRDGKNREEKKRAVALAALELIEPGMTLGVGTGSTANHFIDLLPRVRGRIEGTVASSEETRRRLEERGFPVLDLNAVDEVSLYVDGADECTRHRHLIKGGGGALTREKILAAAALRFVCIVDDSKLVRVLGAFPLPVEVIPMARGYVARELVRRGGNPWWREGFVTDNGNLILDVHNFSLIDPVARESELDHVAGLVTNGIFARRPADLLLVGTDEGVVRI